MRRDLLNLAGQLGADIERFERRVAKAAARPSLRRRIGPPPTRLPSTRANRPTPHRQAVPVRYRRGSPPTPLGQLRAFEERRRGGPSPLVAALRRGAQRTRGAIRASLDALRRGLGRLSPRRRRRLR